jgi:hypothetical protein
LAGWFFFNIKDKQRQIKKSKPKYPERRSIRAAISTKEVDYGISSSDSDDEPAPTKVKAEIEGDKIEKVLDVRDGPL